MQSHSKFGAAQQPPIIVRVATEAPVARSNDPRAAGADCMSSANIGKAREIYTDPVEQARFVAAMEQLDRAFARMDREVEKITPEERASFKRHWRGGQNSRSYGNGRRSMSYRDEVEREYMFAQTGRSW